MLDLRLGDCLGPDGLCTLEGRSVDLVLSDPPFDRRSHVGAGRGLVPFDALSLYELRQCAREFARIARSWILVFCAEGQVEPWAESLEVAGARFIRLGLARRTNPMPQRSGDRPAPAADFIVIAHVNTRGRMTWQGGGKAGIWDSPPSRFDNHDRKLAHAAQKPLHLIRALLEDFSVPGALVADPFAGSATTALACAQTARHFVGWEIDGVFHSNALARLKDSDLDQVDRCVV